MPRTVLITGSSSGFGETTARLFASRGWNVAATMRRPDAGAALARLPNLFVTKLDVEDAASIEAAVAASIEIWPTRGQAPPPRRSPMLSSALPPTAPTSFATSRRRTSSR
jgi:hypothetical protein